MWVRGEKVVNVYGVSERLVSLRMYSRLSTVYFRSKYFLQDKCVLEEVERGKQAIKDRGLFGRGGGVCCVRGSGRLGHCGVSVQVSV